MLGVCRLSKAFVFTIVFTLAFIVLLMIRDLQIKSRNIVKENIANKVYGQIMLENIKGHSYPNLENDKLLVSSLHDKNDKMTDPRQRNNTPIVNSYQGSQTFLFKKDDTRMSSLRLTPEPVTSSVSKITTSEIATSDPLKIRANDEPLDVVGYNYTNVRGCNLPECELNDKREPVRVVNDNPLVGKNLTDKVTVVVKTTQRLAAVMRLIDSVHRFYPGLKFIIVDDQFNISLTSPRNTEKMYQRWREYLNESQGLITYVRLPGNPGLAKGRNVGLQLVKTVYFLLLDDDFIAGSNTNITKLVNILDTTDLTLVAGILQINKGFAGIFRVYQNTDISIRLCEYIGLAYEKVPLVDKCFVVDYVLNLFLARTYDIKKMGGWTESLRLAEHRDFLLRFRKNGYKAALCTDVVLFHSPEKTEKYSFYRTSAGEWFKALSERKWHISQLFTVRNVKSYYQHKCW